MNQICICDLWRTLVPDGEWKRGSGTRLGWDTRLPGSQGVCTSSQCPRRFKSILFSANNASEGTKSHHIYSYCLIRVVKFRTKHCVISGENILTIFFKSWLGTNAFQLNIPKYLLMKYLLRSQLGVYTLDPESTTKSHHQRFSALHQSSNSLHLMNIRKKFFLSLVLSGLPVISLLTLILSSMPVQF